MSKNTNRNRISAIIDGRLFQGSTTPIDETLSQISFAKECDAILAEIAADSNLQNLSNTKEPEIPENIEERSQEERERDNVPVEVVTNQIPANKKFQPTLETIPEETSEQVLSALEEENAATDPDTSIKPYSATTKNNGNYFFTPMSF